MKMLIANHRALCGIVAATFIAGCGQPATTSQVNPQVAGNAQASSSTGPLLYVVREKAHEIVMFSLPDYQPAATIKSLRSISGICADDSGNVWVTNYRRSAFVVDEFAHGGTTVIAELRPPHGWTLNGCAVDPSSGNLAAFGSQAYGGAGILVWAGAQKGTPKEYPGLCCAPTSAVYDNLGNLYISGAAGGDDWYFTFGELPKGSTKFVRVTLDKSTYVPGAVQWDGTYVVVATALSKRTHDIPLLYRLQVTGKKARVVQTVEPDELSPDYGGYWAGSTIVFALYGDTAIGVGKKGDHRFLAAWAYPGGGAIMQTVAPYTDVGGLAVSP